MLVSWAVPKGPSTNPMDKQMARRTGDHPMEYAAFVWDRGTYTNETKHVMTEGLENGHLLVSLRGDKLRGGYALIRIREGEDETWLLVKDDDADTRRKPVRSLPGSVLSGRTLDELS